MAKTYTRRLVYYSLDFKRIVVALTQHSEISIAKISRKLGGIRSCTTDRGRNEKWELKWKERSNSDLSAADVNKKRKMNFSIQVYVIAS